MESIACWYPHSPALRAHELGKDGGITELLIRWRVARGKEGGEQPNTRVHRRERIHFSLEFMAASGSLPAARMQTLKPMQYLGCVGEHFRAIVPAGSLVWGATPRHLFLWDAVVCRPGGHARVQGGNRRHRARRLGVGDTTFRVGSSFSFLVLLSPLLSRGSRCACWTASSTRHRTARSRRALAVRPLRPSAPCT